MPIEIKELHIKATVSEPGGRAPQGGSGNAPDLQNIKQQIIAECVEQVMDIINKQKER